jgi:hypothetical protein
MTTTKIVLIVLIMVFMSIGWWLIEINTNKHRWWLAALIILDGVICGLLIAALHRALGFGC